MAAGAWITVVAYTPFLGNVGIKSSSWHDTLRELNHTQGVLVTLTREIRGALEIKPSAYSVEQLSVLFFWELPMRSVCPHRTAPFSMEDRARSKKGGTKRKYFSTYTSSGFLYRSPNRQVSASENNECYLRFKSSAHRPIPCAMRKHFVPTCMGSCECTKFSVSKLVLGA